MAAGPIACPKCGSEMVTRPYGHGSQTVIEVCSEDCGLWLDAGELEALEQFYEQRQKEVDQELPLHFRIWLEVTELLHRKR
jgi:Zn-finger nucleic acid-binding protein